MSESDTDRPECEIVNCEEQANRELHFPALEEWKPYCDDHTPRTRHDDERSLQAGE